MYWADGFGGVITVTDTEGTIVYMNEAGLKLFSRFSGGESLIGKSLFDCHKPESVNKIKELMKNRTTRSYTTVRGGVKKFFHQAPWYNENKEFAGYLELIWEVGDIPHFDRDRGE
jgi:DUF438 domain-containing protein